MNTAQRIEQLTAELTGATSGVAKVEQYTDRAVVTLHSGAYVEVIDGEPYVVWEGPDAEPEDLGTPAEVADWLQEHML